MMLKDLHEVSRLNTFCFSLSLAERLGSGFFGTDIARSEAGGDLASFVPQ